MYFQYRTGTLNSGILYRLQFGIDWVSGLDLHAQPLGTNTRQVGREICTLNLYIRLSQLLQNSCPGLMVPAPCHFPKHTQRCIKFQDYTLSPIKLGNCTGVKSVSARFDFMDFLRWTFIRKRVGLACYSASKKYLRNCIIYNF